jgi:hypothetical protein
MDARELTADEIATLDRVQASRDDYLAAKKHYAGTLKRYAATIRRFLIERFLRPVAAPRSLGRGPRPRRRRTRATARSPGRLGSDDDSVAPDPRRRAW